MPLYKLASAQIGTFPQIVEKVAALKKPTIFSTGIAAYDEIIQTVNVFKNHGNDQFIVLHCNSIYPTPPHRVNLQLISNYKQMFGNAYATELQQSYLNYLAVKHNVEFNEKYEKK